ncbi:hypothetical protein [Agrobacterium sp. lyk4-40-TYG-31]|uniref:hypothetical protein n=1 Tax=Agrobacterium sp. lyk4-40-TYG-31 TaxID=3040276 RepID=UPI00254D3004|nr:hypothetical protein [Agrobacterium sp. lyk4-40-TYG-31]
MTSAGVVLQKSVPQRGGYRRSNSLAEDPCKAIVSLARAVAFRKIQNRSRLSKIAFWVCFIATVNETIIRPKMTNGNEDINLALCCIIDNSIEIIIAIIQSKNFR